MANHLNYENKSQQVLIGFWLMVTTTLCLILGLILIWFATLRENQAFWTNAGGYPIWLRDLVLWAFYPLLFGTIILHFSLGTACFSRICRSLRFFVFESLFLLLCGGLIVTSGFIAFGNNIQNLLNGNPIRHHMKTTSNPAR